jgi:hypothetical protein
MSSCDQEQDDESSAEEHDLKRESHARREKRVVRDEGKDGNQEEEPERMKAVGRCLAGERR